MFYLDKAPYLKRINFILTHSYGLTRFLARPLNTLYYFRLHKSSLGKYLYDWLISKDEKGLKYLENVPLA